MRVVLLALLLALCVPAVANAKTARTDCGQTKLLNRYSGLYHAVAKDHGKRAPGRNIRKWGLSDSRNSKCRHIAKSVRTLRAMRFRGSYMLVAGKPKQPPAGTLSLRAGGTLAAIAACESGGNPATNTGNGFYGKYQFTLSTWQSVGGSGNPAAASEAEQDRRAAMLYAREGARPWPVCGR